MIHTNIQVSKKSLYYFAGGRRVWPQRVLLHDHLDGSMAMMPALPVLFAKSGKKYPFAGTLSEQYAQVKALFNNAQINIVEKFANTTGVMQSWETLALAAETYVSVRALQGYSYCEAMIAPQYHTFGGLTVPEVVAALIEGIKRGEEKYPTVEVNLIFAVGREIDPDLAVRLVDATGNCDRNYVVGIGLACDEAAHPPDKHIPMFKRAKELGFKTTCHAGEWVSTTPDFDRNLPVLLQNIHIALHTLQVDRIGHAIPLAYNDELIRHCIRYGIGIEGCPGSNLASKLIPNTSYLKIRKLLSLGVLYSLNPDDDLFLPTLDETFRLCDNEYNFSSKERELLLRNAWATRFGSRKKHVTEY